MRRPRFVRPRDIDTFCFPCGDTDMSRRLGLWTVAILFGLTTAAWHNATAATPKKPLKPGEFNPEHATVDLMDAMKDGQVEVRLIPKDVTGGKALITNKSGKPLNVKLPEVFGNVHVLAQAISGVGGGLGQAGGGGMGGGGGGMGGMGGGGGGLGGGGGMFNIAPEKVGEVPYVNVCLEHGKPDPRPSMKYEIRPIESLTSSPAVIETIRMLTRGQISQRVAQILTWHHNNEMSYEELAAKTIEHLTGPSEPYFTADEIRTALAADAYIAKVLEERKKAAAQTPALPKL
jgi:hypothetical protein